MGTRASLHSDASDRETGLRQLERVLRILENTEQELSTWSSDSATSRLNRQPIGVPIQLGGSLCGLFEQLLHWTGRTDGAFDPAIGSLVEVWGIHTGGRRPTPAELSRARARSGSRHFRLDEGACSLVRERDTRIDVGAFGKGEALDRARDYSAAEGFDPWLVDLGGQIMVHGIPRGEQFWAVDLAHPVHRESPVMTLELREGSLATSGGSERDIRKGEYRIGHILDPRTGFPIQTDVAVTVWHRRALEADILSTALNVMGIEDGLRWAEQHEVAAGFLIPTPAGGVELRASSLFRHTFPQR
jgi:thiamine biosynthesis lipoprotein